MARQLILSAGVTHLIADHRGDSSDLLRSAGDRHDPFRMHRGRGDEAKVGTRVRLPERPKETVDAPSLAVSEQRPEVPVMQEPDPRQRTK